MSQPKEPIFFEAKEEYSKGLEFYWNRYFAGWRGESISGEANPVHLFLPWVAPRIKESSPDARLVAILRDPIERAYSEWAATYAGGVEDLPFEAAVEDNLRRLESGVRFEENPGESLWRWQRTSLSRWRRLVFRAYVDMGYYAEQLRRYLALFDPTSVHVIFLEDLQGEPVQVLRGLLEFLDLASETPSLEAINENQAIRGQALPGVRLAHRLGLVQALPMSFRRGLRQILSNRSKRLPMRPMVRAFLREHYRPHNEALARLLGRSLPGWGVESGAKDVRVRGTERVRNDDGAQADASARRGTARVIR